MWFVVKNKFCDRWIKDKKLTTKITKTTKKIYLKKFRTTIRQVLRILRKSSCCHEFIVVRAFRGLNIIKELRRQGIPFSEKPELELKYKGEKLEQNYKPDFICFGKIIVELKAVKELGPEHEAQIMNYLKATGIKLGLLVNFGAYPKADIMRRVL